MVQLVDAEVPRSGNAPRGRYRRTVLAFLASGRPSVRVEADGSGASTLYTGLYKTLRHLGEKRVQAVRREDEVYLERMDLP